MARQTLVLVVRASKLVERTDFAVTDLTENRLKAQECYYNLYQEVAFSKTE